MGSKTILITGATFGIGKETARALAQQNHHVILVGRNAKRAQEVREWIIQSTANPKVDILIADLSLQSQVKKLIHDYKQNFSKLDILINNAGVFNTQKEMTSEGFEVTWAVNHLAPFRLTLGLLDLLKKSPEARVINVASALHFGGKIDFDNLRAEKSYSFKFYHDTKLANVLFTYALSRRLEGSNVSTFCLHPGMVATGIALNNLGPFQSLGSRLTQLFSRLSWMKTPQEGAQTSVYLASSKDLKGLSGKYFADCKVKDSSALSYNEDLQEKLWQWSESVTHD